MVSVISRDAHGSSGRERVRWIERNYATQMDQKAVRERGKDVFNGGLMEWAHGRWIGDGEWTTQRRRAAGGRATWNGWQRRAGASSALYSSAAGVLGELLDAAAWIRDGDDGLERGRRHAKKGRVDGCSGSVQQHSRGSTYSP